MLYTIFKRYNSPAFEGDAPETHPLEVLGTVGQPQVEKSYGQFSEFQVTKFKLSVSNPKSKYVAYLSVLSQI